MKVQLMESNTLKKISKLENINQKSMSMSIGNSAIWNVLIKNKLFYLAYFYREGF